ncbi:MAG: hypothetical protein SH857_05505 [Chitinophagales bacterium]|nr:hypothetical protein [Chitinophagales bacterium]
MRINSSFFFLIFLTACFSSCEKIQENKIIKGTWEVTKVELNHNDFNAMEVFLNDYVSNSTCCQYIVDFKDDNTCTGTYTRNDSIIYSVTGEWEMRDFNLVYVNLDSYVNAELDVNRHSKKYYTLESETNKVAIFGGSETPAKLEIKRID